MTEECAAQFEFEVSLRFRRLLEDRAQKLERDALADEARVQALMDPDHIRRQMRLVLVQRTEAKRMRTFLERSKPRLSHPVTAS